MLQAPPHLSRVCGHGHIKKFWLMQTQKESQACERKSSFMFPSSTSRIGSTFSAKGLDTSSRSPPSPVSQGYGEAGTSAKHSSFTCAQTLSPSFCKKRHPHVPVSTGDTLKPMERSSGVDDVCRTLDQEAQPCTPSPRSYPLNVAFGSERKHDHEPERTVTEADPAESLHSEGLHKSESSPSTSAGDSPNSFGSHGQFPPFRHGKGLLNMSSSSHLNHTKVEGSGRPAQMCGNVRGRSIDEDRLRRKVQLPACSTIEDLVFSSSRNHNVGSTGQIYNEQESQARNSGLKACSLCGTAKTPMWRSGPQGPKSLCNACGIRYKKYRSSPGQNEFPSHAVFPSAAHYTPKSLVKPLKRKHETILLTEELPRPQKMCLKSAVPYATLRQENQNQVIVTREQQSEMKRAGGAGTNRWTTPAAPACFKKIYGSFRFQSKFKKLAPIDEHHTFSSVFAKDEEEAALLLMHLSCGLVY